jgi:hypothetical protein
MTQGLELAQSGAPPPISPRVADLRWTAVGAGRSTPSARSDGPGVSSWQRLEPRSPVLSLALAALSLRQRRAAAAPGDAAPPLFVATGNSVSSCSCSSGSRSHAELVLRRSRPDAASGRQAPWRHPGGCSADRRPAGEQPLHPRAGGAPPGARVRQRHPRRDLRELPGGRRAAAPAAAGRTQLQKVGPQGGSRCSPSSVSGTGTSGRGSSAPAPTPASPIRRLAHPRARPAHAQEGSISSPTRSRAARARRG